MCIRNVTGKVYPLISRRPFKQMEVLEAQHILVTISGRKSRLRVYSLPYLRTKIMKTEGVCVRSCTVHYAFDYTHIMNMMYEYSTCTCIPTKLHDTSIELSLSQRILCR